MKAIKFCVYLAIALSFSCISNLAEGLTDFNGLLPSGATVFVSLDYRNDPDLSEFFLGKYMELDNNSAQILEKTHRIYIGISAKDREHLNFSLVGLGSYPKSMINFGLCTDGRWKKDRKEYTYWTNNVNGMQLSVPGNDIAMLSSSSITSMLDNLAQKRHSGFSAEQSETIDNSLLSVFIPEANMDYISTVGLGDTAIDLEYFLFAVEKKEDLYHVFGEISLHTSKDANAFKIGYKTFLLGTIRQFGKDVTKTFTSRSKVENKDNKVVFSDIYLEYENLEVFIADMFFKKDEK